MKLYIAPDVHQKFPGLEEVIMPVSGVTVRPDETILSAKDFENQRKKVKDEGFYGQDSFVLMRKFCEELGIDLRRFPPSVEFLFRRYQKTGKVPHINNVVDASNKIALETLVATGVFDMDKVEGDMYLRFTKEGEEFHPLGGDLEFLPAGMVVIADKEKILNLFPFRDSIYQKITEKTKNVLILADKVSGMKRKTVEEAVQKVGELLVKTTGGQKGELFYSEVKQIDIVATRPPVKYKNVGEKRRVFSGSRPTGRLHLGNYLGGLKGYLALQERGDLDCIYCVVDYHGLTSPFNPKTYQQQIKDVVLDYLGAGLDPSASSGQVQKCHLMIQSQVPEHLELAYYLGTIFPVSRIEQLPTYKDKKKEQPDYINVGLFYYPILMAADILIYKAELVPVGIDQEPHIELTREVARKFNAMFCPKNKPIFPEPQRFATPGEYVPSLTGVGKMSKSVKGSFVLMTDDLKTIKEKLAGVPTDIGKGEKVPEEGGVAALLALVELFVGKPRRQELERNYLSTGIGYADLKAELAEVIYKDLQPIQERRRYFEARPKEVEKILEEGKNYCSKIARETLAEAKTVMGQLLR